MRYEIWRGSIACAHMLLSHSTLRPWSVIESMSYQELTVMKLFIACCRCSVNWNSNLALSERTPHQWINASSYDVTNEQIYYPLTTRPLRTPDWWHELPLQLQTRPCCHCKRDTGREFHTTDWFIRAATAFWRIKSRKDRSILFS